MPSLHPQKRLEPGRSATWPPTNSILRVAHADGNLIQPHPQLHKQPTSATSAAMPVPLPTKPKQEDPFEHDLEDHPEQHFLSPIHMYEYDAWDDSDDDDGDEVEWSAGITDFALFDSDRRRAEEQHQQVPDRWESLLASQASALQRAVDRNCADSDPHRRGRWTPLLEDVPSLTPDSSPDFRDRDIHTYCGPRASSRPSSDVPNYLTPPDYDYDFDVDDDDSEDDDDDDDLPISFLVERARERERAARKMERPGLRFSRTMSGKVHVWRRPSRQIYPVGEDVEAEEQAERCYMHCMQASDSKSDDGRGRR